MPLAGDGTNLYPLRRTRRCVSRPATWRKKAGLGGSYGGITFDVPVAAQALDAVHFMYDEASQYSVSLEMFPRDPNATVMQRTGSDKKQWTLRAPMLALRAPDPAAGLPSGTLLQPIIFVRNTTAKQISADIALNWRGDSGKGKVKLPELELAPFATRQLQIGPMQKQFGIPDDAHWALVTLTTAAQPDDLIAVASSRDPSGRYNVETKFIGGLGGQFAGGQWRADATHNHLISVTNSGQKATVALLTLHYDNGQKSYEIQQTIQPGDQLWVNLNDLIRQRVPDRQGNVLPPDVSAGTYDVRDLTPANDGLLPSNLAIDTTWGYQSVQPCVDCCGNEADTVGFEPGDVDVVVDGIDQTAIEAVNSCTDDMSDITSYFVTWSSLNPSIAQVTKGQVKGLATGTTTGTAQGGIPTPGSCICANFNAKPQVPITVFDVGAAGKGYIFVGSDPDELYGNRYYVTNAAQNGAPQPPGGTCCADSSDASDAVTPVGQNEFQFQTMDQSATVGDRTLTFEYDLSGKGGSSVQKNVTARQFAYVTNNTPSNACPGGYYGSSSTYTYNVYTHPDHTAVVPTDGLSNTVVAESFSPSVSCGTVTGNGILNTNAQFTDSVVYCSNKPLTCSETVTQKISVAGYLVRTNTLAFSSAGVTYTNNGPTQ